MENEEAKSIQCIYGTTVRNVVSQANELNLKKEDIVDIFIFRELVYLIYYK